MATGIPVSISLDETEFNNSTNQLWITNRKNSSCKLIVRFSLAIFFSFLIIAIIIAISRYTKNQSNHLMTSSLQSESQNEKCNQAADEPLCNSNCQNTKYNGSNNETINQPIGKTSEGYSYAAQLLGSLDTSVKPCDNFYQYACGNWIKQAEIDDTQVSQSGFQQQQIIINKRLRKMLESTCKTSSLYLTKARKAYQACMNQNPTQESVKMYREVIKAINGLPITKGITWLHYNNVTNFDGLFELLAKLRKQGWPISGVLFKMTVSNDYFNGNNSILTLTQPTPSLKDNLVEMISSSFYQNYKSNSDSKLEIMKFQVTTLRNRINSILDTATTTNFSEAYRVLTINELIVLTKIPSWLTFFNVLFEGIKMFTMSDKIAILNKSYFSKMINIFQTSEDYRSVINIEGLFLFNKIQKKSKVDNLLPELDMPSSGIPTPREAPKWLQCVQVISSWFAVGLGVDYARQYYNIEKEVKSVDELAQSLVDSFQERLNQLKWLDESSRKMAKAKLHHMKRNYLFPNWAKEPTELEKYYQNLSIGTSHALNILQTTKFFTLKTFNKLKLSPNNFEDWLFNTLIPNAFYYQIGNSFYITTAILQPPIFQADRLQAMNYGGIGSVIGHEITHGFDLTGTQFNEYGNLQNWLTTEVNQEFQAKSQCFIKQYSNFELTPEDLPYIKNISNINGSSTASENIADSAGLQRAFWAYQNWKNENGPEVMPDLLRDFTPEQVFFISYSQLWCSKYSHSSLLAASLLSGKHSPAKFRVLGTLANFEEFNKAFNCPVIEKTKICELW